MLTLPFVTSGLDQSSMWQTAYGRLVSHPAPKTCASCGRTIEWRRAWDRNWDAVRYCSGRCRRRKLRPVDRDLERMIIDLLDRRAASATICPSEAARAVDPAAWRDLLEPARAAARRLVAAEQVEIVQQGRVVDPSTAAGPIRIRRCFSG